jgi:hypothetical protein
MANNHSLESEKRTNNQRTIVINNRLRKIDRSYSFDRKVNYPYRNNIQHKELTHVAPNRVTCRLAFVVIHWFIDAQDVFI